MAYKKNVWKSKDRITKEKLNNIEEGIYEAHRIIGENGENKDLSLYQLKEDNSLLTSNKNITGAINELFQSTNITGKILTIDNKKYILSKDNNGNITATIINGTSYTITRNLTNCTSSNTSSSVNQGSSYSATITPNSGYTLSSITVTMNGTDITDTAVNIKTDTSNTNVSGETLSVSGETLSVSGETLSVSGTISEESLLISGTSSNATRYAVVNISNVTGNIVISATAVEKASGGEEETTYTITRNLSNCTSSNTTNSVNQGTSYSATITPNSGYELLNVAITMGGTNITSSVYTYQNGSAVINIPSVTGDIVITIQTRATSTEPTQPTTYTITKNLPNCTSSNTASTVNENANYSTLISANDGYKIDSITVTMNGTDITSSVVTDEVKIALYKIPDMTVHKGQTFNILYSSNISAVKHEFSWDGGKTFWDKTNEILVENTVNYRYRHNAETNYDSFNMAIRVTDANGSTDVKYFTITFENNATENPPAESGNLLDSTGAYVIDDFSGSSVDRSKWDYELGYVRNGELQNYTSTNTEVSNSILALKGIKDSNGNWTASSIISKGHFAFMYGKIECRAKIDPTLGSFSAFWTLGDSFEFGYHDGAAPDTLGEWWAYCGEFDVMEFYSGKLTCGTFFNEREESGRVWYNNYDFNAWHTFAMEWLEDGTLIFSIDGNELSRTSATDNRAFHIPHFILINQAIGASGGTPADSTTAITQYVDWVKYYPASTSNLVLNSSDFSLQVTDHNDSAHNCMVRPIFNDNCINKSLTWSSSDSSLVWVHSGLCGTYAGANGTVTITATSHSGVSKSITLTVTDGTIR